MPDACIAWFDPGRWGSAVNRQKVQKVMLTPTVTPVRIARTPDGAYVGTVKVPKSPVQHNVPALSEDTLKWEREVYAHGTADAPHCY